jgi:hypothetical protein
MMQKRVKVMVQPPNSQQPVVDVQDNLKKIILQKQIFITKKPCRFAWLFAFMRLNFIFVKLPHKTFE